MRSKRVGVSHHCLSASYSGGDRSKFGHKFSKGVRHLWKDETLHKALCVHNTEKRLRKRRIEQFWVLFHGHPTGNFKKKT